MSAQHKTIPKGSGILPSETRAQFFRIAAAFALVGIVGSIAGAVVDPKRFGFSYLVGFLYTVSLGLGALFFVILQHLVRAGWSVVARRTAEWMSLVLVVALVLFIPVFALSGKIFEVWMGPQAAHDHLIQAKTAFLNKGFFYGRALVYLVAWAGLAYWFFSRSREQDRTGDVELSRKMRAVSAPAMFVFALSLTFASFDWIMSLDPHWYSTIFGVYYFSGSVLAAFSALALATLGIQRTGVVGALSTVEHRHDIGKFMFGFVIFWAYIGFSQFMLIWYANIPEETIWYKHRWEGSWKVVSMMLLFGHFIVPFLMLLSRHAKRSPQALAAAATLILGIHYVDLYWLVMPNLDHHGAHPHWIDLAGLLAPLSLGAAFVARFAMGGPAYPLKDPFLAETMRVENL